MNLKNKLLIKVRANMTKMRIGSKKKKKKKKI